jgi:hypothetical protein
MQKWNETVFEMSGAEASSNITNHFAVCKQFRAFYPQISSNIWLTHLMSMYN